MLKNREKFKRNDKLFLLFSILVILIFLFQNFEDDSEIEDETVLSIYGNAYEIVLANPIFQESIEKI